MSIQSIEARVEKATKGPWKAQFAWGHWEVRALLTGRGPLGTLLCKMSEPWMHEEDARFMSTARQDIPALLKVAKALIAEREAHHKFATGAINLAEFSAATNVLDAALAELESME